jgi:hypothetical protein
MHSSRLASLSGPTPKDSTRCLLAPIDALSAVVFVLFAYACLWSLLARIVVEHVTKGRGYRSLKSCTEVQRTAARQSVSGTSSSWPTAVRARPFHVFFLVIFPAFYVCSNASWCVL